MKKSRNHYDVIIIGGGSSGLMAAGVAAERGKSVLILEKNDALGKKLKITGGGRCNITNAEFDTNLFLEHFPQAKKFLYSPFSKFSSADTFTFFQEKLNLPLTIQEKNRAFPASEKALDVYKSLEHYIYDHDVQVILSSPVTEVTSREGVIKSVSCDKELYTADSFILCTGGMAAPETGSTGDGFSFLKSLGHTVKEPDPSIVPLTTDAAWIHALSGTKLSDVEISFWQNNKKQIKKRGDILLTHFGISGPTVLNSATQVKDLMQGGRVTACIDLFPNISEQDLDQRLIDLLEAHPSKLTKNILDQLIPKKLIKTLLELSSIEVGSKKTSEVSKAERRALIDLCKKLQFPITGTLGYDKAVIADGGVVLEEVDFSNMSSRLYPNLYLIGDTLSINRPSGGYSLQLCWTTAWIAGNNC